MQLNKGQKHAKNLAIRWFQKESKEKQVFYLAGAAGTGKTSLVLSIIEGLGLDMDDVAFLAYTGKASLVLRRKGIPASTIHHCIYQPVVGEKNGKKVLKFILKEAEVLDHIRLMVIDECSMVGKKLWADLISFHIPIIILGDINQLPPVKDLSAVAELTPDAILTDIVRQEADNPLIQLSQRVIAGELYLPYGNHSDKVWVVDSIKVTDSHLMNSDVVLCGKNNSRDNLNAYIRHELLHIESKLPVNGDKLICRKNSWQRSIKHGEYCLINGMIGYCDNIVRTDSYDPSMTCRFTPDFLMDSNEGSVTNEGYVPPTGNEGYFMDLPVDLRLFRTHNHKERQELIQQPGTVNNYGEKFEYGYAITTHLAQGSEWNKVLCFVEFMGDKDFMRKWLYTAITRSSDILVLAY